MDAYRDLLDDLFIEELGYEFCGTDLPVPDIIGKENLKSLSREYAADGVQFILADCNDRIPEFQKHLIKHYKNQFPDSHFLFVSNQGRVVDLYNVSSSNRLKKITYDEINRKTKHFNEKIQLFNVEEANGTVDLKIKADKAFDASDKITKKFYEKYHEIHSKLKKAITGIPEETDRSWYASVLMNRIMFIYFLQKNLVIQNDYDFLL
ncbi:hypothetical protein MJD09_10380, partial [bacterium]|nr:hypothetical protein [bacterium]